MGTAREVAQTRPSSTAFAAKSRWLSTQTNSSDGKSENKSGGLAVVRAPHAREDRIGPGGRRAASFASGNSWISTFSIRWTQWCSEPTVHGGKTTRPGPTRAER